MGNDKNINLYEVRKTVRFIAEPLQTSKSIINFLEIENKQNNDEKYDSLGRFLNNFKNLISLSEKLFFYENNGNLRDNFKIKYRFLQNYTKYDFYEKSLEKNKTYSFKELNFIEDFFKNYFKALNNIYNNLDFYQSKTKDKQNRYREIGIYLQKLSGKNISILKDLFEFLVKTNKVGIDRKIEEIKTLIPEFETKLIELLKEFGPNSGLEIAKGSFNYYILNKSGKVYFNKQITNLEQQQKLCLNDYKLNKVFELKYKDENKNDITINLDETFFENIGVLKNDLENMTLERAYNFLKDFKAKRKSAFSQFVGNGYTYENLINKVKDKYKYKENGEEVIEEISVELFADIGKDSFEDFKKLTDEINNLGKEINDLLQPLNKKRKDYEKEINKKNIEERTEEENKFLELSKKVQNKAKERGKYFNIPTEIIYTQNYKNLCELYKNIALKLGQNKARILGFEKQIVDSEKLKFFAVITEKGNDKFLALIPKGGENFHKKAFDFLNDEKNNNSNGNINIYSFKSLTLRALQKLCFKDEDKEILIGEENLNLKERNTFIKNIIDELSGSPETQNKKYFYNGKLKRFDEFKIYDKFKDKKDWKQDEKLLVEFYKDVLKTNSAKRVLDLKYFGLDSVLENDELRTLDEFELALEKVAYIKNITKLDENGYKNFIESGKAFEYKINSQDLSINDENHKNKKHTNYWLEFWTDDNKNKKYGIRINPEFSLYYTLADEDLKDKQEKGLLNESKKLEGFRNRKLKNQLIFTTNFSLNANEKLENLSFLETIDLKENINKFNEKFEKNISKKDLYYFGIDRGINELATLSVTKFLDTKNDKGINNFEFAKIECFKLKSDYDKILDIKISEDGTTKYNFQKADYIDKNGHTRSFEVSKNISYFLPKTELFENITTGIIDLTQAKLIGEKIILNGDKSTLLKLKELSAKRRIFELLSKGKIHKNSILNFSKKVIYIVDNQTNQHLIYWFTDEITDNEVLKEKIKNILVEYLKLLDENNKFEDIETISKIDHLRDAITSNMVGIIHFLIKKQKLFGKIILENLDEYRNQKEQVQNGKDTGDIEKMNDGHFYQSNTDISRRLEWSLYRKFQETGFVPPEIKQSVFLKEDFGISKFGIIEFVEVNGTSSTCPYCNKNFGNKKGLKEHYKEKNDCGFTKQNGEYGEFRKKDNSINYDSIASFTIGKFAFEGKIPDFVENKKVINFSESQRNSNNYVNQKDTSINIEFRRGKTLSNNKK